MLKSQLRHLQLLPWVPMTHPQEKPGWNCKPLSCSCEVTEWKAVGCKGQFESPESLWSSSSLYLSFLEILYCSHWNNLQFAKLLICSIVYYLKCSFLFHNSNFHFTKKHFKHPEKLCRESLYTSHFHFTILICWTSQCFTKMSFNFVFHKLFELPSHLAFYVPVETCTTKPSLNIYIL